MLHVKDININYKRYGDIKGDTLVLLHGWGQNIEMMEPIGGNFLENDVIIFDLPGFGKSEEPKTVWTIKDYAECIHECLNKLNVKNPIMIGHSFGGKITLMYASMYDTKKIVLLAVLSKKVLKKCHLKPKC